MGKGALTSIRLAGILGLTIVALALTSEPADAAAPCPSVTVDDTKVRVAAVGTSCEKGREIAAGYFERAVSGEHFDGKSDDGSIYYDVAGFRCLTGLGGTQMFCRHRNQRVYASSRPEDHPSTWRRTRVRTLGGEASSRRVYFVIGCSGSVYQPEEIALTCADGKVRFEANERWEEWGPSTASTHGTLRFVRPCARNAPHNTCVEYNEDKQCFASGAPSIARGSANGSSLGYGLKTLTAPARSASTNRSATPVRASSMSRSTAWDRTRLVTTCARS